jgi:hypothetical protein
MQKKRLGLARFGRSELAFEYPVAKYIKLYLNNDETIQQDGYY